MSEAGKPEPARVERALQNGELEVVTGGAVNTFFKFQDRADGESRCVSPSAHFALPLR